MRFLSVVCLRALARVREGYRIKLLGTGSALLARSSRMQATSTTCPHERAAKDGEIIDCLSIKTPFGCSSLEYVGTRLILLAGGGFNGLSSSGCFDL